MNRDGSHQRQLTNGKAKDGAPSFSPDGRHIAFQRNNYVLIMRADGSNLRVLDVPGWSVEDPCWIPIR
jgi:Tol biopolymer transport system component